MSKSICLGFWSRVTTACVSLGDYNLLLLKSNKSDEKIKEHEKTISDLKDEIQSEKDKLKAEIQIKNDLARVKDEEIKSLENDKKDFAEKTAKVIDILETNLAKAKDSANATKQELLHTISLKDTDLNIAYADLKAVKDKLSKAEVDLTIFKEKLEIESARKEIKSSRGNSALKKDEVLRVVSLREENRGIVSIAKEMDLTIDSVENILNGVSYTRWTKLPRL